MSLLNLDLATRGSGFSAKWKILKRHVFSFFRHMTVKKLVNFTFAEMNRIAKKEVISSYPYILKIESTNICNVVCLYCYDGRRKPFEGERPYGRMSFDNFKKIIDEVGPYLFKINLYGFGEPFLFPETLDMINYATIKNVGIGVSSNLNFDDESLPKRIVESGLETLIFSCHGIKEKSYNKFMGKGNIKLALGNVKKIVDQRAILNSPTPFIDWQYCVTKFNEMETKDAVKIAKELGVDQIRFIKPYIPPSAGDEWHADIFKKKNTGKDKGRNTGCSWPYRTAYINYDGGILPCCRDIRLKANDFGNVFDEGFINIWNNEKYSKSRRLIANPSDKDSNSDIMCSHCASIGTGDDDD